jgi:hypothetical protein
MVDKEQAGHRQRLRERFLAGEPEARSDETLLELLLAFAIGRKDVKPLAEELIRVFKGLSQVLSASPDELRRVKGIGEISVALLKVVHFIKTGEVTAKAITPKPTKAGGTAQQRLFETLTDIQAPGHPIVEPESVMEGKSEKSPTPSAQPEKESEISQAAQVAGRGKHPRAPVSPKKKPSSNKITQRKFQVSNGYLLEFDQLARVLHFLLEHRDAKRINRKALQEDTGLADRHVEGLVSMGSAMGLIKPGVQVLTSVGLLVAEHDIFLEKKASLEWCHYKAAGSHQNLIWFEVFNRLLQEASATNQAGWQDYFREKLKGQYTDKTIKSHVTKEVRFIIDAYTKRNFAKLEILHELPDGRLYQSRYTGFALPILAAMIYDYCATYEARLSQIGEMATAPGTPAMVFGLDGASFRQQVEALHERGWLRYETTHNLDQIRLKPGFSALEFLTAYFEDREPKPNDEFGMMNDE